MVAHAAVDFVRVEDGLLAEHRDVIEDEATREQSASGLPMYGASPRTADLHPHRARTASRRSREPGRWWLP
ncbi:hypothetical protein ACH4E7_33415 [Kitasatospora sp. NPDC018058]|uniref:hypothetical protein n=1 Tax=Kitasatospora sp. NPDC018058 TaxID=3364025 RepID=UPI0037BF7068